MPTKQLTIDNGQLTNAFGFTTFMKTERGFTTTSLLRFGLHERSLHSRGFTLIELLVVVSIIAILSTIGLAAYSSVLEQGRDSKRQSDLRSIQSALEQFYADQFYYPAALTFGNALSFGGKTYFNIVPAGSPAYVYTASPASCDNSPTNKCTSYCLYATLENSSPGIGSCPVSTSYNFAVTPP